MPLFEFLANQQIHPNQRLIFAPVLDPLAMGLSDLNKYVLRESSSNHKVQELINKYTYKENYYWLGYLQHLETLGLNKLMSYGDFRMLWGEETQKTRSLCSVLERYAWKASPIQKLVLAKALEGSATVFCEAALEVVMELQQITKKEYIYLGGGYVGLENHHILNTPEMLQVLAEIELTDSQRQAALELAQNVFELFTEAMNELFGHRANGIRAYTNKTRLRGLKSRRLKLCYLLQSAEADIVCVDANSIRRLILMIKQSLNYLGVRPFLRLHSLKFQQFYRICSPGFVSILSCYNSQVL